MENLGSSKLIKLDSHCEIGHRAHDTWMRAAMLIVADRFKSAQAAALQIIEMLAEIALLRLRSQ
jgi:hypothetical protein